MDLYIGRVFKNYKIICEWLGVKPTKGKGRQYHIREFERYCKYHTEGQKYIIDEVYKKPLPKVDGRVNNKGGNNIKYDWSSFKIKKQDADKCGVYKITKDNKIYIGSTIVSFKERFKQHLYGCQETTSGLLHDGWIFEILYISNTNDEICIREKEQYYINKYLADENWIIINLKEEASCVKTKQKFKHKVIKVDERQYDLALNTLKENGILIYI